MKSGAKAANETLLKEVLAAYQPLVPLVQAVARAKILLDGSDDLNLSMARVNDLSLAMEDLADAAKAAHEATDRSLLTTMMDTGCTTFSTGQQTVYLRQNPETVEIADEAAVPADYLLPPRPDRKKIGKALKDGSLGGNWANLREGSFSLSRRAAA